MTTIKIPTMQELRNAGKYCTSIMFRELNFFTMHNYPVPYMWIVVVGHD